jgi:hypothetical protein
MDILAAAAPSSPFLVASFDSFHTEFTPSLGTNGGNCRTPKSISTSAFEGIPGSVAGVGHVTPVGSGKGTVDGSCKTIGA